MTSESLRIIADVCLNNFPLCTNEFLSNFKNCLYEDIQEGFHVSFEIKARQQIRKICPILTLARPKHAAEIARIYKELYNGTYPYKEMEDEKEVQKMIENPNYQWVLFKSKSGKIIGCFTFILNFKEKIGYIRGLMLRKKYQGTIDVVKAALGSYISMYSKYKNQILRWYCENRTAHSKSQFALSIGGIRAIAFYPNKDVFNGKIESDIMHICYDERALKKYRSPKSPHIIPEVVDGYLYSNTRYNLGSFKLSTQKVDLNHDLIDEIKKKVVIKSTLDKFGYEEISFSLHNSDSYFKFLHTPTVKNFEKTAYKVNSLEELYVFIQLFMRLGKEKRIRYCEVIVSAYEPEHQKIFVEFGLYPRGYIPSWKYDQNGEFLEDYILFNYYKGEIDKNIQLISEGKKLLTCLGFNI